MSSSSTRILFFVFLTFLLASGCLSPKLAPISLPSEEHKTFAILNWADCVALAEKDHPELLAGQEAVRQASKVVSMVPKGLRKSAKASGKP